MSIKIEKTEVFGWEAAIRGMRNPKNSWDRADTDYNTEDGIPVIGPNDLKLAGALASGGSVHGKYRRMLTIYVDITAPFYWWKEADTYKVGTVADSCSTMHKITAKEFEISDFSYDHMTLESMELLRATIRTLNYYRNLYLETTSMPNYASSKELQEKAKEYWWQLIQLLPTSYNQKRTVMLNYEVANNMYFSRKDHKLDEWHVACDWIKNLPYANEIILCGNE